GGGSTGGGRKVVLDGRDVAEQVARVCLIGHRRGPGFPHAAAGADNERRPCGRGGRTLPREGGGEALPGRYDGGMGLPPRPLRRRSGDKTRGPGRVVRGQDRALTL
ncbi:unnamed protein product, partial [Laminaria digitata]